MDKKLSFKKIVKEIHTYSYGPTIAVHTGFGSIALFSFEEIRK